MQEWCGRPESNRHRPCGPTDFLTRYGFRRPAKSRVWGLDYPFALAPKRLRRRPSSLYTFPPKAGLARDRHFRGFPDFERFYSRGFPHEHSNFVQVRCVYQFRHARMFRDQCEGFIGRAARRRQAPISRRNEQTTSRTMSRPIPPLYGEVGGRRPTGGVRAAIAAAGVKPHPPLLRRATLPVKGRDSLTPSSAPHCTHHPRRVARCGLWIGAWKESPVSHGK